MAVDENLTDTKTEGELWADVSKEKDSQQSRFNFLGSNETREITKCPPLIRASTQ